MATFQKEFALKSFIKLNDTRINFITAIINISAVIYLPPSVEETPEMIVSMNNITQEIVNLFILKY